MNFIRRKIPRFLKNNRLHIQLLLYFLIISVLLMAIGSYVIYRNAESTLRARNEQLVTQQFAQVDQNIANLYSEVDRLMEVFLEDADVQMYFQTGQYNFVYRDVALVTGVYNKISEILDYYDFIDSIYLFTSGHEAIGTSRRNTLIADKTQSEHPFFATDAFNTVFASSIGSVWYGGFTTQYFNELTRYLSTPDEPLISDVKAVTTNTKVTRLPSRHGVVVCNISESYVRSLYNALTGTADDTLYLVDGNGQVVSAANPAVLNEKSPLFDDIDQSKQYGSVTLNDGGEATQLIYYRLSPIGWTIMRELPLKADMESALGAQHVFLLAITVASVLAVLALSFFWFTRILSPLSRLAAKMQETGKGRLDMEIERAPHNEIGLVINRFNEMLQSLNELMRANERIEREKRGLEIEALQAQLNPHFLYNTLNMIKWMAVSARAKNIEDSLVALGNILRPVFRNPDTLWALREELDYLDNYVKIMNWRYNNNVSFRTEIEPECLECGVPRFILQPVVENAVVHGFSETEGVLSIRLKAERGADKLVITVTDNGIGIAPETLERLNARIAGLLDTAGGAGAANLPDEGQKIGIMNVARRIRLYYGEDCGLTISSPAAESGGTAVTLRLGRDDERK
ncbi:MAG: sensor histidine kinase [Defluviitaleaceae bacterium]|nr:sensor histidine kinase [Defluviitaleaceae bacterium]